jgi:hypothetical protein
LEKFLESKNHQAIQEHLFSSYPRPFHYFLFPFHSALGVLNTVTRKILEVHSIDFLARNVMSNFTFNCSPTVANYSISAWQPSGAAMPLLSLCGGRDDPLSYWPTYWVPGMISSWSSATVNVVEGPVTTSAG